MPDFSCASAIVSTVRDKSLARRRPGSSSDGIGDVLGGSGGDSDRAARGNEGAPGEMTGLVGVHDEALADEWIEHAAGELQRGRLLLDLPAQEAVVRLDEAVGLDRPA